MSRPLDRPSRTSSPAPDSWPDEEDRYALEAAEDREGEPVDNLVAVMSGVQRKGYWQPASQVNVYALMGGAMLDFRDAGLLEGTTVVDIYALMGGATLVFPPDIQVESHGNGLMGGFSHLAQQSDDPDAPRVVVRGFVCMGGVEIKIREPFEPLDDEDEDEA